MVDAQAPSNGKTEPRGTDTPCYIGRLSCGCAVAACVDDPRWKKETARDIARWIKDGYSVERTTCGAARLSGAYCEGKDNCASPKQKAKQEAAAIAKAEGR